MQALPKGAVVIASLPTSYEILAAAPVYVVGAPIAHVANTKANDPAQREIDVDHWLATGDPAIPAQVRCHLGRQGRPSLPPADMKVLLVTLYFPPAGGGGVQRPLKFATHLPELGIETHVLAPDDPKWIHRDDELPPPTLAWVHRVRFIGPEGRRAGGGAARDDGPRALHAPGIAPRAPAAAARTRTSPTT